MFIGIDLGTSGVKVIVTNELGDLLANETVPLPIYRPKPLWSEQDPNDWWQACDSAMRKLSEQMDLSLVKAIGLSGQMHGATLLDNQNNIIRPAILWNDGRCEKQCKSIETEVPNSRAITGNIMMPGFTAGKIRWIQENEPQHFSKIAKVLLPKDYIRFLLSGVYASDMSDASGTMWLDVSKRCWSEEMLAASGLSISQMPLLYEGSEITGTLTASLAQKWHMNTVPIIAGGGDNAAGAAGVGMVKPGHAMLSLGTSGVYFLVTDKFYSNPASAVHSFCHAIPNTWHLMSVVLSAASSLQWFCNSVIGKPVDEVLSSIELSKVVVEDAPIFLPYLSGDRTPHNNPFATGNFFGLTQNTNTADFIYAILEGVSFAFADGMDALHSSGKQSKEITLIGGGAKNQFWRQLLANILNVDITYREGGDVGPAFGAARLAQLALSPNKNIEEICPVPPEIDRHSPDPSSFATLNKRLDVYRTLYRQISPLFIKSQDN